MCVCVTECYVANVDIICGECMYEWRYWGVIIWMSWEPRTGAASHADEAAKQNAVWIWWEGGICWRKTAKMFSRWTFMKINCRLLCNFERVVHTLSQHCFVGICFWLIKAIKIYIFWQMFSIDIIPYPNLPSTPPSYIAYKLKSNMFP